MKSVGTSTPRVDAVDKVTGKARYPGDFNFSDQLWMKVVFARRAHARILDMDISEAQALPGVLLVLTAPDVPNNEYGLSMYDQPVLCGINSPKSGSDHVRFEGDQVALVVAESQKVAKKAAKLIKITYEDLPLIENVEQALEDGAFVLHPNRDNNIFHHNIVRFGNADEAFKQCDVVVEQNYMTPVQEHAYLQPEAGVAYMDEGGCITLIVAGQWTHKDKDQIVHALQISPDKVRVIYPSIGGAFGGREDMSVQIILALAVMRLAEKGIRRPVKVVWSREESIIGHHKRHAYHMWAKWGATKDGKLVAAECRIYADGGAYAYTSNKVLGNATLLATGPYSIPNVKTDSYCVYTNNIPGGAFRGFGGPQANFMAESQMDLLAAKLKMDPVEFRNRNIFSDGSILSMGSKIPDGVSIKQVIERCAHEAGWVYDVGGWKKPNLVQPKDPSKRLGLGFACGYKNIGFSYGAPENCGATIAIYGDDEIEKAVLYHAGAEVGQGVHTVIAQFTAEALGIEVEKVELQLSDTHISLNSGSASASRLTFMAGNSIIGAANEVLKLWQAGERPAVASYVYRPPATTMMDKVDGHCNPNFAYGYVAQAVLAEVNTQTGEVHLKDVFCVDDVGKAINPDLVKGQIYGAVVQSAGYAILEDFKTQKGLSLTNQLSTYLIPTIMDIPDKTYAIIEEFPDPIGPYGARGMGEMPSLPFASAVIGAVEDAIGIRFTHFPLTAETVLRGLGKIS